MNLSTFLFTFMVNASRPGGSLYSFEPIAACGTSQSSPACALDRVCAAPGLFCDPPRWSPSRTAWVRLETRETALIRYAKLAERITSAARWLLRCTDDEGRVDFDCKPVSWPGSSEKDLASAIQTVVYWETGLREDIYGGHPPVGRGKAGETCMMQIMPAEVAKYATWVPEEERVRLNATVAGQEELAKMLLGDAGIDRCLRTGGRMLARKRRYAEAHCKAQGEHWTYSMFAMYGTGHACSTVGSVHGDYALDRQETFVKIRMGKLDPLPSWAAPYAPEITRVGGRDG